MKITKLKNIPELAPYQKEEVRDKATKEELHEVLVAVDKYLNTLGDFKQSVIASLQDKMAKYEQLTLDFGSYTYEVKNEVKRKFNNDFTSTEDEAKFLEDMGFPAFVTRDEKTVNTLKIDRTQLRKAYEKNTLPESIASHYSIDEETNLKIEKPKEISKAKEE